MPILHKVAQRSAHWDQLRLGIPTSSEFKRIVTAGKKSSDQRADYMYLLIAEAILGHPIERYRSRPMVRGAIEENEAIDWYGWDSGNQVEREVGFITDDKGFFGYSPDGLIGDDGLVELKCPEPATQVRYWIEGTVDQEHWPQLQGGLYISERQWIDIVSWHGVIPRVCIRVERDEKYIEYLAKRLNLFHEGKLAAYRKIVAHLGGEAKPAKKELRAMLKATLAASP